MQQQVKIPFSVTERDAGTTIPSKSIDTKGIVIIGANGAGKTRFGQRIRQYNQNSKFIFSQKSLRITDSINIISLQEAEKQLNHGAVIETSSSGRAARGGSQLHPSYFLNDYTQLLQTLFGENTKISNDYRLKSLQSTNKIEVPKTKLDDVKEIWESVITHRTLELKDSTIMLSGYAGSEMSDGEKLVFYIIGQVVCAIPNQIIIIDEPKNHLHQAIVKPLYDKLQAVRPDCIFVYLTHDIDFAFSRNGFTKIWLKSYEHAFRWDYEILSDDSPIPEQLYLEILGSRRPVIFIEGDTSSKDYLMYQYVFPDYLIKPTGGCAEVKKTVKAFNDQKAFHNIDSYGIIDRDRLPDEAVSTLNEKNIWVLNVAEVENLLLIEPIVKAMSEHMGKNSEQVFEQVKTNIITFFTNQLGSQTLLHLKDNLRKELASISDFNGTEISAVSTEVKSSFDAIDLSSKYAEIKSEFEEYISTKNYEKILTVLNHKKAVIPQSKVCNLCDIKDKHAYFDQVVSLLKKDTELAKTIKDGIKSCIQGSS